MINYNMYGIIHIILLVGLYTYLSDAYYINRQFFTKMHNIFYTFYLGLQMGRKSIGEVVTGINLLYIKVKVYGLGL